MHTLPYRTAKPPPPKRFRRGRGLLIVLCLSYFLGRRGMLVAFQRLAFHLQVWFQSLESVRIEDAPYKYKPIGKITAEQAGRLLERAGRAFSHGQLINGEVFTPYARDQLAVDICDVIAYLDRREPKIIPSLLPFCLAVIRNLLYAIPGYGVSRLRQATLSEDCGQWPPASTDPPVSLQQFGYELQRQAYRIILNPHQVDIASHNLLACRIGGLDQDECVDVPMTIEEQIPRLQGLISTQTIPPIIKNVFAGYATIAGTLLSCIALVPWDKLGNKSELSGVAAVTPAMALLLVCSTTLCSLISLGAVRSLDPQRLATSKTLAKATTVLLALSTLFLGVGLSASSQKGVGPIPGLLIYVMTLMATLAADNLVNQTELHFNLLKQAAEGTSKSRDSSPELSSVSMRTGKTSVRSRMP